MYLVVCCSMFLSLHTCANSVMISENTSPSPDTDNSFNQVFSHWNIHTQTLVLYWWKWNGNEWCFRPRFCTVRRQTTRRQPGLKRWILLWIMPLVQDRSLDLLASIPARYHCTTDAALLMKKSVIIMHVLLNKIFCYIDGCINKIFCSIDGCTV